MEDKAILWPWSPAPGSNLDDLAFPREVVVDSASLEEHAGLTAIEDPEAGTVSEVRLVGRLRAMRVRGGVSVGGSYRVVRTWYKSPLSGGMVSDE